MRIKNFNGTQNLNVVINELNENKFVTMEQYGKSMRFQMDITPEEARKFAQHLIECADILGSK